MTGLTTEEVAKQRALYGSNIGLEKENLLWKTVLSVVTAPMFILLLVACLVYILLGNFTESFAMLAGLIFVSGIDIFQNYRSQRAINAINKITSAKAKVVRDNQVLEIHTQDIVKDDLIICEEGITIPADAEIVTSNDFLVNEATITGESVSVAKQNGDVILQGTVVVGGYSYAKVTATGKNTTLSAIGTLVKTTGTTQTPLQKKVTHFVRYMVVFGSIAFLFVWAYNTWESGSVIHGLLHGLTMAMSVLPEELPVAFSTFMALGAYRLLKVGIIAKSPQTVETLGSATVICVDKTGTLTKNIMTVNHIYDFSVRHEINYEQEGKASEILAYAMWASEETPFDPMEKSIHEKYALHHPVDNRPYFKMIREYPLSGNPPVMTHVFEHAAGERIIACKGSLEGISRLCKLEATEETEILTKGKEYARKGFRVLGVAKGHWEGDSFPAQQEEITFTFLGLITFYDPPDENIPSVIKRFYQAGLRVIMITGDYPETAEAIAAKTGIKTNRLITGDQIATMDELRLKKAVSETSIFARISPAQKLKIIEALKSNGEIVAMTGDGVNDAPALRAAHIGVSMGKRGTDVAKSAAGLVLAKDDLSKMVDAVFLGRRINRNLKKAFKYIISIHIPIILLVSIPIFMEWLPSMLLTPIHVIFLELIMGPTCSIIYENEPYQEDDLLRPLDASENTLLKKSETLITILQGLVITAGCVFAGHLAYSSNGGEEYVRTIVLNTLLFSNIFLTLINRSFSENIFYSIQRKNRLIPLIIGITVVLLLFINYSPFLNGIFETVQLTTRELLLTLVIGMASTLWIEFFKKKPVKTGIPQT